MARLAIAFLEEEGEEDSAARLRRRQVEAGRGEDRLPRAARARRALPVADNIVAGRRLCSFSLTFSPKLLLNRAHEQRGRGKNLLSAFFFHMRFVPDSWE